MLKYSTVFLSVACSLWLSACQPEPTHNNNDNGNDNAMPTPRVEESGDCAVAGDGVNFDALLNQNCHYLSSYRLFADNQDPTQNPNGRAVPYDLTTPLFTDYASKYRFAVLPESGAASYADLESFEFPVGSVLIKTFALPADTAFRGIANETLIETRLLIHRETGWTALPYVWLADGSDAELKLAGATQQVSLIHNGEQLDFTYAVPDKNKCKQCHQTEVGVDDGMGGLTTRSVFSPIGPKARLLNSEYSYQGVLENQLSHWQSEGLLTGVPADLSAIPTIPSYQDEDALNLGSKTPAELETLAKGYLDINCAHCHRELGGNASNTGLHLEFWRELTPSTRAKHGVCKTPIAYSGAISATHPYDIEPGDADTSLLVFRMETLSAGDRMPELGRLTQHAEGVALIRAWINSMDTDLYTACTPIN